jgi:hypothetical protein
VAVEPGSCDGPEIFEAALQGSEPRVATESLRRVSHCFRVFVQSE